MKINRLAVLLTAASAVAISAGTAQASGFMVRDNSVSAMMTSYAGAGAYGYDPSHQIYNPATLGDVTGHKTTMDVKAFFPSSQISVDSATDPFAGDAGTTPSGEMAGFAVAPNGFGSRQINDRFTVGFGVHAPFAAKIEADTGWSGQYQLQSTEMVTYNFQAGGAWKAHDWLTVGAAVNVQYFAGDWRRTEPIALNVTGPGFLEGNDIGLGFTVGVIAQPTEKTRIGLTYKSAIDHVLDGTAGIVGSPGAPATTGVTTPDSATLSFAHMVNDKLTLLADVGWTGWAKFTGLDIFVQGVGDQSRPQDWHDTFHAAFGGRYMVNDRLTVGAGILFDQAAPNSSDNTLSPDGDRVQISAGFEKKINERMTMAAAVSHQLIADAPISVTASSNGTLEGTMMSHVTSAGFSLTREW